MTRPRISLITLMAVVVVVALNAAVFRSLAARPGFLSDPVRYVVWMVLPMVNVLAIAAAIRSRRRGSSRALLVGFEVVGWAVVLVTALGSSALLEQIITLLEDYLPSSWQAWINGSEFGEIVAIAVIFGTILLAQILIATLGGLVARWVARRREVSPSAEPLATPSRVTSLVWLALGVAIPVGAIEAYLRVKIDPKLLDPAIVRLVPGSTAVVDLQKAARTAVSPRMVRTRPMSAPTSSFTPLDGSRVRVDSDAAPWRCELVAVPSRGVRVLRDLREVRVTLLEGDRKGEMLNVPHYVLRVVR